jgi:hypothetical protein
VRWSVSASVALGVAAVLAFVLAAPSHAQLFGHHANRSGNNVGPAHVDCDVVAAASGMDKATCEAMNQAEASYYAAQHDPAGARPGDDDMTCDRIKAEMMTQPVAAPPPDHVAEAQAAATDFNTKEAAIQAKMATAATALTVAATAASAASLANPIAGRAADAAVEAAREATEKSLNAEAKATVAPAQQKMLTNTATLVGDMMPQLQNNPRLAHLVQMSSEKHCRGF